MLIFIVTVLVGLVSFSSVGAYAVVQSWLVDLSDVNIEDMATVNDTRKTRIYASDTTTLLAELYVDNREPVTADQVSPNVFNATVSVEDERFWSHRGVDYYGIARAAVNDLLGGELQGASTITQQLVRQTLLQEEANESTIKRKVREAYLALEAEKEFTKEELLMMYLNTINYGDGALGIQAAAQHYFSKNASELTIPEAALLCGIPQNPTYNNPVEYPDNALTRRNRVLDRMYVNGHISEEELEEFKASEFNLNIRDTSMDGIYAQPYFVTYVSHVLQEQYSYGEVFKGGLTVYTTIDLEMQAAAEEACAEKEASLIERTGDEDIEVGLTCVDPNTGYIKAMRGGKDYYTDQFNTSWQMKRQAGSTFKVFALVAAIEQGYSPQTSVSGKELHVPAEENNGTPWNPVNYQSQSMGIMTLAEATWRSSNLAYGRVARTLKAPAIRDTAIKMGVESVDPEKATSEEEKENLKYPNLPIVLGAYGVNTLEMASAFGTLATGGVRHEPTPIMKVVDRDGNIIYERTAEDEGQQVLTPEVAYATNQVLKGVVTGGTGTAANLGWQVAAGKTGTSDEYKDSWFVGYTPQLSTAVWIGSRGDAHYIPDNVGGDNCCPVWKQFMSVALSNYEAQDFPTASNPPYNSKASFMNAAEKKAEEEEKKKKEEEEKKKQEEEEAAAKKKEEEEKAAAKEKEKEKNEAENGGTGGTDGGTGGTGGGTSGGGTGGGASGGGAQTGNPGGGSGGG
ncbi:MAG: PBP1A family penicillin-binding protein [Coriobacteriales bacterium]|jgi:penicillin-binding protein 1A|nr:PBP1A family penicillin-binding protein [Coriobacteriales bacterium]